MLPERLGDFIATWCDIDADPDEVAEIIQSDTDGDFAPWLKDDLRLAIQGHDLTAAAITRLTNVRLVDQQAADKWLRRRWKAWFPTDPYPV